MKPREFTTEEIRAKVIDHIRNMVNYWGSLPSKTEIERLEGLAFSILVMLDGNTTDIPGFMLIPNPHESDKEYLISCGENYYPYSKPHKNDVGGSLHDEFFKPK